MVNVDICVSNLLKEELACAVYKLLWVISITYVCYLKYSKNTKGLRKRN